MRKHRRWLPTLAQVTGVNCAFLTLVWLLANTLGERWWLSTLCAYLPLAPLTLLTPVLLLCSLRKRRLLCVNGGTALLCLALLGVSLTPPPAPTQANERTYRVVTFNMERGGSRGVKAAAALLWAQDADILCLQEARAHDEAGTADPLPTLKILLPGYHWERTEDVVIASREPILATRTHPTAFPNSRRAFLEVQLRDVTVVNVHFATTLGKGKDYRYFWEGIPDWITWIGTWGYFRGSQVEQLVALGNATQEPLLVCGDFNLPPSGLLYRRLTAHFADVHDAVGFGTGYTWTVKNIPCLRIDHLLTRNGARPVTRPQVIATKLSDHYLLVCEIAVSRR
jgi:endonuclease/exonuclease/phosphatase (EEP) superfamily protein YafD